MAHLHISAVLQGSWKPGGASFAHLDNGSMTGSSLMEELGPVESPPPGFFRRLGFHCRLLWRRIVANVKAEWPLLKPRLWVIIPCLIFQYVHAIFTGMAYYMHTPLPVDNTTLHDLGFEALPYLSADAVSEVLIYTGFVMFFAWALSPFVLRRKHFYFVVVAKRVLVVLVLCQVLRICSFLSTQIPAPAPHCRAPEPTSNVPWPVWWKVIIVNVARQATKGCGDLIFSSHFTFILIFTWTYAVMGRWLLLKAVWFLYALALALCIIASRKHYTVDIVVAAYVVPLVFFHFSRKWTTTRDDIASNDGRRIVALGPALPVTGGGANGSSSSTKGGSYGLRSAQEAGAAAQRQASFGCAGSGPAEVRLDLEMAGRASSAPYLDPDARPPSPVKRAAQQAWDAVAALPGRVAGRAPPAHRRTESQEPVLLAEDVSASSVGN